MVSKPLLRLGNTHLCPWQTKLTVGHQFSACLPSFCSLSALVALVGSPSVAFQKIQYSMLHRQWTCLWELLLWLAVQLSKSLHKKRTGPQYHIKKVFFFKLFVYNFSPRFSSDFPFLRTNTDFHHLLLCKVAKFWSRQRQMLKAQNTPVWLVHIVGKHI